MATAASPRGLINPTAASAASAPQSPIHPSPLRTARYVCFLSILVLCLRAYRAAHPRTHDKRVTGGIATGAWEAQQAPDAYVVDSSSLVSRPPVDVSAGVRTRSHSCRRFGGYDYGIRPSYDLANSQDSDNDKIRE